MVYRCEGQVFAFGLYLVRVEYVAQPSCLLLAVGKNVYLVAHEHIVGKRACEQFKVFVKQRLRRNLKRYGGLRCAYQFVSEVYASEGGDALLKS